MVGDINGGLASYGGEMMNFAPLRQPTYDMFGCGNGVRPCVIIPPPFLTKLFEMVNDPNTNFTISWGSFGNSLIIWDHIKFSVELLPKYFKHSNFSSFMYQLNNYGFRKIGVDHQWEFENPYFKAGNESLLANIKRRNQLPDAATRPRRRRRTTNLNYDRVKTRLEILRNRIAESKLEIEKLKQHQSEIESHIVAAETGVKNSEIKPEELIKLLTKVCDPIFALKIDEIRTKRKFDSPEISVEDLTIDAETEELDGKIDRVEEDVVIPVSENQSISVSTGESTSHVLKDGAIDEPVEDNVADDYAYWEQMMMEDCDVCENETESYQRRKQQDEIAAELEGLIANLPEAKQVVLLEISPVEEVSQLVGGDVSSPQSGPTLLLEKKKDKMGSTQILDKDGHMR